MAPVTKYKQVGASTTSTTDDKNRKEVQVKTPVIILGIHSNVPASADFTDGHAWISVSRDGVVTNYGLWPDDHPRIIAMGQNDPKKSDIRVGMEDGQVSATERYYRLSPRQAAVLEQKLKENVGWHYTNTCASWASETVLAVTGEDVDANDTLGFETPRHLSKSITTLEKRRPTNISNPQGIPDDAHVATSSSSQ
ncbi:hypothetical protein [Undibacterium sp.]|uniref:hypothetical protein n=1 Tax=Undibacterium sp. TaxID=1914977 RepID=UPI00374D8518